MHFGAAERRPLECRIDRRTSPSITGHGRAFPAIGGAQYRPGRAWRPAKRPAQCQENLTDVHKARAACSASASMYVWGEGTHIVDVPCLDHIRGGQTLQKSIPQVFWRPGRVQLDEHRAPPASCAVVSTDEKAGLPVRHGSRGDRCLVYSRCGSRGGGWRPGGHHHARASIGQTPAASRRRGESTVTDEPGDLDLLRKSTGLIE